MADVTINDLSARSSLAATDVFEVDNTSSVDDSEKATFALMGGMEVATGSDADTTMVVGTLYRVDMSAWATAVRTYRLPSTAQVGERIGIHVTAGNATHELAIRTVAASNDTINGTDYDSADWSKLFITGETVVFECVVADTAWIVLVDGRIPCTGLQDLAADLNNQAGSTDIKVGFDTTVSASSIGNITDDSGERMVARRNSRYWKIRIGVATSGGSDAFTNGERVLPTLYKNSVLASNGRGNYNIFDPAQFTLSTSTFVTPMADGDVVEAYVQHTQSGSVLDIRSTRSYFQAEEVLAT